MANLSYRVLVVEFDSSGIEILKQIFKEENLDYDFCATAEQAWKKFSSQHFDLIMSEMDFGPDKMTGEKLLAQIREQHSQLPFILISDPATLPEAVRAVNLRVEGFLLKPLNIQETKDTVRRAIRFHKTRFLKNELVNYRMHSNYQAVIKSTEQSTLKLLDTVDNLIELVYPEEYGSFPDLKMAIYEALSNAMEHGNRKKKEENIFFEIELKMDRIMVHIKDQGKGFNTETFFRGRGAVSMSRGLKLIDHLMDEVSFNIKGNEINLLKILPKRGMEYL